MKSEGGGGYLYTIESAKSKVGYQRVFQRLVPVTDSLSLSRIPSTTLPDKIF
jgi:hypothetical protein